MQQLHDWPPEDTELPGHHRAQLLLPRQGKLPLQARHHLQRHLRLLQSMHAWSRKSVKAPEKAEQIHQSGPRPNTLRYTSVAVYVH